MRELRGPHHSDLKLSNHKQSSRLRVILIFVSLMVFAVGIALLPNQRVTANAIRRGPRPTLASPYDRSDRASAQDRAAQAGDQQDQSRNERAVDKDKDDDDDDADLPSFFKGHVDKQEYLRMRGQYIAQLRGLPHGLMYDPRVRAIQRMERAEQRMRQGIEAQSSISSLRWNSIGPAPIPNGGFSFSGRVTAIAVHPTDPSKAYVGTAQGGLYRTLDGGTTWTALMDTAQSLAIGAVAIAPSSPSTVFVGTGEANSSGDSFFGVGLYRIDNADTTPVLNGPFSKDGSNNNLISQNSISQIAVNPADANTIFVSTTAGIGGIGASFPSARPASALFRSTNALSGAVTFTKFPVPVGSVDVDVTDIAMEPGNGNNLLIATEGFDGSNLTGGVFRSTNALSSPTFTRTLAIADFINVKLAINKVSTTVTVLAATGENSGSGTCSTGGVLRRSTDGGQTFSAPITAASGYCAGQCFYDILIGIDPGNSNVIYIGGQANGSCGAALKKSTDGGASFAFSGSLHPDSHAIGIAPSNTSIVYAGNDGGIWRTTNAGGAWTSLNNTGFNATQFQSLALHPSNREFMIGGTQDNGSEFRKTDATWVQSDGGDGGYTLIDQSATDTTNVTMYHTYFNQTNNLIGFARATVANPSGGGWSFFGAQNNGVSCVSNNGIVCSDRVLFYAPMALGPGTPNTVYFGTDRLYRSIDKGSNMIAVSQGPLVANVPVSSIGISPQDDNVRIVGLSNGKVFRTTTGSSTLNDVTGSVTNRYISRAVIDPNNTNTAYVTVSAFGIPLGAHVWKTTNLSAGSPTWTMAGAGIPDVPVNAFVVDKNNSNNLYAGTDIGVFNSTDGGANWTPFGTGLPRVAVFDMAIQNNSRVLRVATHGRGIWEISISSTALFRGKSDFEPDLRTELTFYRDGTWGVLKSSQSFALGSAQFFSWGGAGLPPVVADFDGDGKTDLGFIAPPAGGQSAAYSILKSSTGYSFAPGQVFFSPAGFPALGDTPVVGDFDGDGKADPGIWRASMGIWIIPLSSTNYTTFIFAQWGQQGDVPIVADFDGDEKADLAFYRDGTWGVLKSSQGYSLGSAQFFSWGGVGLPPIVGDFDGDGKADLAYVAPPAGGQSAVYSILKSSTGYSFAPGQVLFVPAGFPSLGDTPVVGDFDGDGKSDPGIWRASQGIWIIPLSSSNFSSFVFAQWGQMGDIAMPNKVSQF
ncbi:MAG: hypothetical protein DMF61_06170 [Blastocatellia bacterium AA13]|nr:MAG: hypothetical protein DMF61_06170 [Blastocatellia bacterium AA13]